MQTKRARVESQKGEAGVDLPGTRLLMRSHAYVIYEHRFYSDDPLACQELAPSPHWWELVISLTPLDRTMLTCPRAQQPPPEIRWFHHHLVIQIKPEYLRELLAPESDRLIPELAGLGKKEKTGPQRLTLLVQTPWIAAVIRQMVLPPPVGSLRLFYEAKLKELLAYLCFQRADVAVVTEESRLQKALEYLESHLDEPYVLKKMSEYVGLSMRQCQRLFRVTIGTSPSVCLSELRLQRAAYLLCTTKLSISEIALEVGYASLSHFSKAFQLRFGKSPRAFRRASSLESAPIPNPGSSSLLIPKSL